MSDTENMESSVQLEPHCLALADGGIEMTCRVSNGADRELYLFDALWKAGRKSDPEKAYRFVAQDRLVVLVGIPPLPYNLHVFYKLVPDVHVVPPGESVVCDYSIAGPIKEYNPYQPEEDELAYEIAEVEAVDLMVDCLWQREGLEITESPTMPGALLIQPQRALKLVERLTVSCTIQRTNVLKRTDEFERP